MNQVDASETHGGTYHTHQGTAGNEAGGQQRTLLTAFGIEGGIGRTGGDIPVDGTAHYQRHIQLQRDEHAQGKGQGRNLAQGEHDGQHGTDAVEQPGSGDAVHQRLDDGCHGIGLRGSQLSAGKSIGLVEHNHHATHGSGRHDGAQKLPTLLLDGGGTQPIANLQVGDEAACHGESGTYDTAHHQGCHHAAGALKADSHHDDRSQDEGHQRHARYRIGTHNGDGVGCYGSEKEGDDSHQHNGRQRMEQVALHHVKVEKEGHQQQCEDGADGNDLHREIALRTLHGSQVARLAPHLLGCQSDSTFDDAPRLDDADDAGHGDTTNADTLGIVLENLFG